MTELSNRSDTFRDFMRWKDMVCNTVIELDCARPRGHLFSGDIGSRAFYESSIINVRATPHSVERDRRKIAQSSQQFVLISRMASGQAAIMQDGREAVLHAGDMAIYDTSTPYAISLDREFDMSVMRVQRSLLSRILGDVNDFTARTISGREGMGRVCSLLFSEICGFPVGNRHGGGRGEERQMHDLLLNLVTAVLGGLGAAPGEQVSEARHQLYQRAMHVVERELGNEDLSCDFVARQLGVSHRYLRKVFADREASLSEAIIARRLIEARRLLAVAGGVRRSVSAIAFDCGFKDPTHFSRAFRARFGMTPREFRQQTH